MHPEHPIPDSYWISPSLLAGEYPSERRESPARKKLTALLDAGIRSFVDLTEEDAGLAHYDGLVKTLARERGHEAHYRRMAIPDAGVATAQQMTGVLAHIEDELSGGRPVYVHCLGGIGRTGTVAGCWMVEKEGRTALQALERIARLRKDTPEGFRHSPETREQREFIVHWACARAGRQAMSLGERCDALLKFAPHFDAPGPFATLVSPMMSDAAMVAPYCELAPWASDFVQTLEDAGWCVDCNWEAWQGEGQRYVDDPALVAGADADALARLLTVHVHLDRRHEGHLADMAERGHLKAILGRLKELRDQHAGA
jgi:protein-tyrosine phosphatase